MFKYIPLYLCFLMTLLSFGQVNDCACCGSEYEAFDFWIGTWEVINPDGSKAGYNTITKIQDNCALLEKWESATAGFTGTSTNFYNANTELWEQIWIDNKGGILHLKGNRKGNQMILQSDPMTNEKGEIRIQKITWTANSNGTVRQLWEIVDQKGTATIAFDGLYKRR